MKRNVIVTGASRGIGRGIATVLAREGFGVGLLARSEPEITELEAELSAEGAIAVARACDVRDPSAVEEVVATLARELGGIDALVNNAGVVIRKDIFALSLEEWREMVETNISGVFHSTRAALPFLLERQCAHIINISSISGRVPLPGGSGYAASKYAVTGFSDSLFHELRDRRIHVTTLYPGSVDSASHRHDPAEDTSWKATPRDVGEACASILRMRPGTCVSQLEIRPLARPPSS